MIFFTSDTHFWHKSIIHYCNRPWATAEEMNEGLIKRWNERIKPTDTVFHLGDFCFAGITKAQEIFNRLNGILNLVKGNHDNYKMHSKLGWQNIYEYLSLKPNIHYEDDDGNIQQTAQQIILCHFPFLSWDGMAHGSWHLHGHCHGSLPYTGGRILDVGVDPNDWYPLSLNDVQQIMIKRQFKRVDHHNG
jgi:calcineurin-like phosphoesterase family protein